MYIVTKIYKSARRADDQRQDVIELGKPENERAESCVEQLKPKTYP